MSVWPELIIFDCDGVLVDSEVLALDCLREAFAREGVALDFDRSRDLFLGRSQRSMRETAKREFGLDLVDGFEDEVSRATLESFDLSLVGVPGVREALTAIGAPVCVASSSPPERIAHSLALVGYDDLFAGRIFSADEVKRGKPAPDLFLHAARRLKADPAGCLVIEDAAPGLEAASSAGMTAYGFTGAAHAEGARYAERLQAAGASRIFSDMRELPAIIDAGRRARRGHGHG